MNGELQPTSRALPGTHGCLAFAVAVTLWGFAGRALPADQVYKSVDAEGHVVFSDHPPEGSNAQRYTVQTDDPQGPPQVMHFCWTNCFTLNLDNGLYRRADGSDETWTVERFTSTSVVLHRHDAPAAWNGFSPDVVYEGQVSNGRLVNITIGGKPASGVDAAWGVALSTLPGSNAERDQGNAPASPAPLSDEEPVVGDEVQTAEAPPPLPSEEQPPCSTPGYLWTPGYWAWGTAKRYYWVPGVWVAPPRVGVLWTPGYWQFAGAVYVFHPGYWAAHVGYYGGINYGFGYSGVGFSGGRWVGGSFAYNSAVNHLNASIHNTYSESVPGTVAVTRVSFNGGPGGTTMVSTPHERSSTANVAHPAVPAPHRDAASSSLRTAQTPTSREPVEAPPAATNPPKVARPAAAKPARAASTKGNPK